MTESENVLRIKAELRRVGALRFVEDWEPSLDLTELVNDVGADGE